MESVVEAEVLRTKKTVALARWLLGKHLVRRRPDGRTEARLIIETVRRNGFRADVYIRPSFYKSTKAIGVRLHDLDNELYIITLPFGNYIDTANGVRLMTSSWRRNADEALPARG